MSRELALPLGYRAFQSSNPSSQKRLKCNSTKKPLQKSPGDPPALPWVCCPEGTQPLAHPWSWISSGGSIAQEQQLCSTRRGTEGKNKHRRTKCASVQGLQDFGWLWLGAGSVQFSSLSRFLPRLHSLIPKIQNEQGRPRGLRHLNTP